MKKRKIIIIIIALILLSILALKIIPIAIKNVFKVGTITKATKLNSTTEITIVPTMNDKINQDSAWCGIFQLLWNDLKNEVVKKDIVFKPQLEMVKNLNKEDFTEKMISEEYYYKKYGLKTLELKDEIEKGIMEKFNQTSDVLDSIDWSENELHNSNDPYKRRYLFYAMLYRKFEYLNSFNVLEDSKFGDDYENVKYFGINHSTSSKARKQIDVLYYYSKDDFAIILNTKTNDEVVLCKSPKGKTFNEIYNNMNKEANQFLGKKEFRNIDEFKAPNIEFNEKKEYTELERKVFLTADPDYPIGEIINAIQSIKFSIDEKGGEIKSEAYIDYTDNSGAAKFIKKEEPRYFYLDDAFAIFLREKGKEKPYFAARIDDITKYQK